MTTFFIGRHRCFELYCYEHGFKRMHPDPELRAGTGILFCNSIQAVRGREVKEEDIITTCTHCLDVASQIDIDRYEEVLEWLEHKKYLGTRIHNRDQKGLR